jgi:hypothetical protein
MQSVEVLAAQAREHRRPVPADNPFLAVEGMMSDWISQGLTAWGKARDAAYENTFLTAYGSPLLRARVGLGQTKETDGQRIERDLVREADAHKMKSELEQRFEVGDTLDAAVRALCWVHQPERTFDEREFAVLKQFHSAQPPAERRSFSEFKEVLKEQALLVRLDHERAIAAIPKLIDGQPDKSRASLGALHKVLDARDGLTDEGRRRLKRIDALFKADGGRQEAPHA